jgi:hypothetical protein
VLRAIACVLLAAALTAGCRDAEVVTASYATLAEAAQAGAIERGRIPRGLPPGTRELREAFDPDTNRRWGLFSFPPPEGPALRSLLDAAELPVTGQQCSAPRRLEWWPVLLRGSLDAERIAATGLRVYRSRAGDLIFGVNWSQGRAYYWSD